MQPCSFASRVQPTWICPYPKGFCTDHERHNALRFSEAKALRVRILFSVMELLPELNDYQRIFKRMLLPRYQGLEPAELEIYV
jgi:hypothetical protein